MCFRSGGVKQREEKPIKASCIGDLRLLMEPTFSQHRCTVLAN